MRDWDEALTVWALEGNVRTLDWEREIVKTFRRRLHSQAEWVEKRNREQESLHQWGGRKTGMIIGWVREDVSRRDKWEETDGVIDWEGWSSKSYWFLKIWVGLTQVAYSLERLWVWTHEVMNSLGRKKMIRRDSNRFLNLKGLTRKTELLLQWSYLEIKGRRS